MKKITILLFSIFISFSSYGEWKKFGQNTDGSTFYIDIGTIKEHGGYVYYWILGDYLKPSESGTMSGKAYYQGECGVNRYKTLSFMFYKQPMGGGTGDTQKPHDTDWRYPSPGSVSGYLLKYVCNYVRTR